MATTVEQIDFWRAEPSERQALEFKEASNQYPREKLYEYCCAIGNEGGGHLILGVSDSPPRRVVGTNAFSNIIAITEQIFNAVGFRVDVEVVAHPGGRVLVFSIPSRLRGTAYQHEGKYLMRSGASIVAMSQDRLRAIFSEGAPHWGEEASLRGLSADEVVRLLDTQAFFDLLKQPYPTDQNAVLDRLMSEQLVDFHSGAYAIRRFGALLIAKHLSDFPDVASKAARVIVYNGVDKLDPRLDDRRVSGYASDFQALVNFVMSQVPQNEVFGGALRREAKVVPVAAMRELIANALIHQDLTLTGMYPTIEIYSDRVEISNPGEPIVSVERFIDGYQSRNERLTDLMRRMSVCEERGSGIDRVTTIAEITQLPAPYFDARLHRTYVIIYGPRSFDDMNRDDRIRACYQHCVLKWVVSQRMSNQSLRERFGLPDAKQATVSQIIAATQDEGLIKRDPASGDSPRYARYLPHWA